MTIRLKIIILVCVSALIFSAINIAAGYICVYEMLRKTTGEGFSRIAVTMAGSVAEIASGRFELVRAQASNGLLKTAVNEANLLSEKEAKPASRINPNAVFALNAVKNDDEKIFSILLTDKSGFTVASTDRAAESYQGDKTWWLSSYDGGKGKAAVGDIAYAEGANLWTIQYTVPVRGDSGEAIGLYRESVDISSLFTPLENFKMGDSGRAALVDGNGYLIFYPNARPLTNKFCDYKGLQSLLESNSRRGILENVYLHPDRVFAAFGDVDYQPFLKSGIRWRVFIIQDEKEVFKPLAGLVARLSLSAAIIIAALLLAAMFVFNTVFTGPTKEIAEAMGQAALGRLDHKIELKTGGETGELVRAFNEMVDGLKRSTAPIALLNKEIDARQAAETKVDRLSSDCVSLVSQLRVSIMAIKEKLAALAEEGRAGDKHKKAVGDIESDVEKQMKKADAIVDIANIEGGRIDLKVEPVDVRALIKGIVLVYEPKIREKGLNLKLDVPAGKINIYADTEKIKRVFVNLVDNAVKFTHKGLIEIAVKELPNSVECSVSDTGEGISRELMNRIFDRSQAQAPSAQGLERAKNFGLFIAKGIVEMHKGRIWIDSEVQKGTKITFILPKYSEREVG